MLQRIWWKAVWDKLSLPQKEGVLHVREAQRPANLPDQGWIFGELIDN